MTTIKFTQHFKKDRSNNILKKIVVHYIMVCSKKTLGKELFKIEHRTKKGKQIYILYKYYKKRDEIWVINAKQK